MKLYPYKRWLAAIFVAVMAFAAGANMPPVSGCLSQCVNNASNEEIIRSAAIGLSLNVTLWLSFAACAGITKKLVMTLAVFFKMFLCGVACRAISADGAGLLGVASIILAAASAATICFSFLLRREDGCGTPLKRISFFIAGVSLEAVALPSLIVSASI